MKCSPCCQATTRWTIFGLSILMFVLSIVVVAHCKYLMLINPTGIQLGAGLFSYEKVTWTGTDCVSYEDDDLSGPHKTSRAFGILAIVCTLFAMIGFMCILFCLEAGKKTVWMITRVVFILAVITEALTFSIFGDSYCDDDRCSVGPGARGAFVNLILLAITVVLSWCAPPPDTPVCKNCCGGAAQKDNATVGDNPAGGAGDNVNVTVTRSADGKITTIKEVTHPDGTKTTTTTIEELETAKVLPVLDVQDEVNV